MSRMTFFDPTSRRVRFSHYFTVIYCLLAIFIGMNLRDSSMNATTEFRNTEVGIIAHYPQRWLLDTASSIMRVADTSRAGFKTVIQIQVLPFGSRMSPRNIIDALTLERQETLSNFRNLTTSSMTLPNQDVAIVNQYQFVYALSDPFLQSVLSVVIGRDVLVVRRNQAILITFQADSRTFDSDLAVFEQFLSTLEY